MADEDVEVTVTVPDQETEPAEETVQESSPDVVVVDTGDDDSGKDVDIALLVGSLCAKVDTLCEKVDSLESRQQTTEAVALGAAETASNSAAEAAIIAQEVAEEAVTEEEDAIEPENGHPYFRGSWKKLPGKMREG